MQSFYVRALTVRLLGQLLIIIELLGQSNIDPLSAGVKVASGFS